MAQPVRRQPRDQFVERRQFARGQFNHPPDEVDAVDQLRDTVFDLQPGVYLEERGGLAVRVVEELDRTGT